MLLDAHLLGDGRSVPEVRRRGDAVGEWLKLSGLGAA